MSNHKSERIYQTSEPSTLHSSKPSPSTTTSESQNFAEEQSPIPPSLSGGAQIAAQNAIRRMQQRQGNAAVCRMLAQRQAAPAQTIQRAPPTTATPAKKPAIAAKSPVPGMSGDDFAKFFTDFRAATKELLGKDTNLDPSKDFTFLKPSEVGDRGMPDLKADYTMVMEILTELYQTKTDADIDKFCAKLTNSDKYASQRDNIADMVTTIQWLKNKWPKFRQEFYKNGKPDDYLLSVFMSKGGETSDTSEPSQVIFQPETISTLIAIIHEGVHRLAGRIWTLHRDLTTHYYDSNKKMLMPISKPLTEGTTQILTNMLVEKLKKWFPEGPQPYYAQFFSYVEGLLSKIGKDKEYLKEAYVTEDKHKLVEALQAVDE